MGIHNLRIRDKDYMVWASIMALSEELKCNSINSYATFLYLPSFPSDPMRNLSPVA